VLLFFFCSLPVGHVSRPCCITMCIRYNTNNTTHCTEGSKPLTDQAGKVPVCIRILYVQYSANMSVL